MPLFSVILPTYNRANFLKNAIQSVMNQSFPDFELLVIDDGSTDNTWEIVRTFKDSRVCYHYQENKERSAARNTGIKIARGEYICFLDSDDVYLPWHLEILEKTMKYLNYSTHLVFTDIDEFNNMPFYFKYDYKFSKDKINILSPYEGFKHVLLNPIGCMRWCVRGQFIKKHLFNEKLKVGEDTELFTRLLTFVNDLVHIQITTVLYTEHPNRSVNLGMYYFSDILVLNMIFKNNPLSNYSNKLKNICYHKKYLSLARHFIKNKMRYQALKYILRCFITRPLDNFREKVYITLLALNILKFKR